MYCSKECSFDARQNSCRKAEKRYQLTLKGKLRHALRQRRYRMRQKEKVTDHSSIGSTQDGLLESVKNKTIDDVISKDSLEKHCHFCKKAASMWLRSGFLRYYRRHTSLKHAYLRPP
jgi:hypothetical protein